MIQLKDIEQARLALKGQIIDTPFTHSRTLSEILGAEIWLKFENLQFTASFKERGAYNRMRTLTAEQRKCGVITMSAGNHAQGVAYHAQRMDIPAVIVMPKFTPTVKVANTRRFGAEVILHGETFDDARALALELAQTRQLTLVHPYDDDAVIAGQGTIGLEMLEIKPDLDMLIVPIGGGGLISGIATAAKALRPEIEVIGVQTEAFPYMAAAVHHQTIKGGTRTIAEGIAVKTPGVKTLEIIRQKVDDIVLVSERDIEYAIVTLLEIEKTVVEGAGAAGLAALLHAQSMDDTRFEGKKIGVVLCGGNIDPLVLGGLIERGMVRAGRLTRIRVSIHDLPGALSQITQLVADTGANITEVNHQRAFTSLPAQDVEVDLVMQTRGHEHVDEILTTLRAQGFRAVRGD
ncbi:MAG: threonine ammonia-lyase [Sheuella sp.]|nr:threonine ammonia-lyase [Sheuella sp.]